MSDSAGPLDMTTRRWHVLTAVLVGALLTLSGLVGGLIAKAFADHEAGLRLQTALVRNQRHVWAWASPHRTIWAFGWA